MRQFVSAAAAVWLGLAAVAEAESTGKPDSGGAPAVVVELFTSQGCSSCPPADELFTRLAADPRVIPLALHVDYWDYIGWTDGFAQAKFTERQKAYARAAGSRMVYTPQMIVGGEDRVEGNKPDQIEALIRRHQKHQARDRMVTLDIERQGDTLQIRAVAERPIEGPVRVQLVHYRPSETVEIRSGENAGKTVTYHNIVTDWQALGEWTGADPLSLDVAAPADVPAVVILQAAGPGEILAAARVE